MKIEKVNDNQIKCTLTKEDLASRQLKISELAYGSEKAKSLFRDMMQQANFEFGFEAEDIPLMIEAVPVSADCIVLIITKVEDPEELDTRFSRFAPSIHEDAGFDEEHEEDILDSDEIMDLFQKVEESAAPAQEPVDVPLAEDTSSQKLVRLFQFDDMSLLLRAVSELKGNSCQESTLYKDYKTDKYLLLLTQDAGNASVFNRLCNTLSEYSTLKKVLPSTPAYLREHLDALVDKDALGSLAMIL
ncbi:MAG: adaptor protein MecA [Lachnospiraceae bacterium]|nr:adaptor protein MecA [Lachnospiraceae bacterium]